ncbi:40S ribosomal protein S27-like [Papio anubis]|uniref:40S ribosomal protein S27-like n=2 Tax=Cercopithecinae TaxID=9528 RepID=UPI0012ADF582|nr:40S ribosomal protein S27-like [Papio anubis]
MRLDSSLLIPYTKINLKSTNSLSGSDDLPTQERASRKGSPSSLPRRGEEETQEETPGAEPQFLFMDVKCPGCYKVTTVFSHAQTVVLCVGGSTVLCQPTGGKARLTEGCSFRRKQH